MAATGVGEGDRQRPPRGGVEARKIALRDLLLALRLTGSSLDADMPFSAVLSAEIARDGAPEAATGRMAVGPGYVGQVGDPDSRVPIDRAELSMDWDPTARQVPMPFQIVSGGNGLTLVAQAEAPRDTRRTLGA